MAKLSIIIPVFGVEKYIKRCVESLLAQELDDMEFIFVDDHTPDNSIVVVKQMIENHPRKNQFVFLKTPQNGGAGPARNYGMEHATGEYIGFVDSDDWVTTDGFSHLYTKAKECDADMCFGKVVKNYTNGNHDVIVSNPDLTDGDVSRDAFASFLVNYVSFFTSYIYRRSMILIHNLVFYSSGWSEDSYFLATALLSAKRFASVPDVFYHYVIRPGSASTSVDESKYLKRMAVFDGVLDFAHENGSYANYSSEIDFMYIKKGGLSTAANYVHNCSRPQAKVVRKLSNHLFTQIPDAKKNKYVKKNLIARGALLLLKHFPHAFIIFARLSPHE